jgi:hypothetical protein
VAVPGKILNFCPKLQIRAGKYNCNNMQVGSVFLDITGSKLKYDVNCFDCKIYVVEIFCLLS